ncbi:hypothetical protein ACYE2N_01635 [Flavobacterium sp. MAHUQ-51]|uniref:hypothetical protein n=1 Tax=Flavobacterium sp. GCM10022190 TaxID=3252639 RepID=UPI0036151F58
MEKEIKELIRTNENDLNRWINERNNLRNKIRFCSKHKFEEEVRIAQSELKHFEGIIYDYENCIKDLKILVKSYEKSSSETES